MPEIRFDRAGLLDAFDALGRLAWTQGKTVDIAIYGGSALILSFDWRLSTKDVDGVYENDRATVRSLAAVIGKERGWPNDWLNDGVKGFLSARDADAGEKLLLGEFPSTHTPGLRVFVARPEYLFAMKRRAMRVGGIDGNSDVDDIRDLAREIGFTDTAEALALVASFYPDAQLQPNVRFSIEEILANLASASARNEPR